MPAPLPGGTLIAVNWLRSIHSQVRAMDPFRADAALAALFVVAAVVEVFLLDSHGDSLAVTVVAAIVVQAALAFRRRDPLLAAVGFSIPTAPHAALGGFPAQDGSGSVLSAMVPPYSIRRY